MIQSIAHQNITEWITICRLDQIPVNTGVCALVNDRQVAIFHWRSTVDQTSTAQTSTIYAIDNYDPFSNAYVLSRGLVGDRNGTPKVASPIYKQNFDLQTGQCLDDPTVAIATYPSRIVDGQVQVGVI
jgi:nitrite reductase (NADH) small subunit